MSKESKKTAEITFDLSVRGGGLSPGIPVIVSRFLVGTKVGYLFIGKVFYFALFAPLR